MECLSRKKFEKMFQDWFDQYGKSQIDEPTFLEAADFGKLAAERYFALENSQSKEDSQNSAEATTNKQMDAITLKCEISEILLSSYMSDEREADKASAEIMKKIA